MQFSGLTIGVPKEILAGEFRVAATPETARRIADMGGKVILETGAGAGAHYSDAQYRDAGAEVLV